MKSEINLLVNYARMILALLSIGLSGCSEDPATPQISKAGELAEVVNQKLIPLSQDPLLWTDDQLKFLDPMSEKAIVGLGEATHGTAEFFKAKHRIFRYLVEKHGFKVFAIEADFGESIILNQAVLNSDKSQIESLMKEKMLFWTWKTSEVRDLLFWMCDYNLGKTEDQKVQYWGIDCQSNTHHPDIMKDYLKKFDVSFFSFAAGVLDQAKSTDPFYMSQMDFSNHIKNLTSLKDSITKYQGNILAKGSKKEYQLMLQLTEEMKEVYEIRYKNNPYLRDEYMAKNTRWLHQYFNGAKIALWAHNGHVADRKSFSYRSMGNFLTSDHNDYAVIGFLFSKGSFMARTQNANIVGELKSQSIEAEPKSGSVNKVMSLATAPVFAVNVSDITEHDSWKTALAKRIDYFMIGSTYSNNPQFYYTPLENNNYHQLIYFNNTTAATPLK